MAFFRRYFGRQNRLVVGLFVVLLCILVGKILWPNRLAAQGFLTQHLLAQNVPVVPSNSSASIGSNNDPNDPGVNGDNVGPEFAEFDLHRQDDVYHNVVQKNNFQGATQVINELPGKAYNPNPSATTPQQVYLRVAGITDTLQPSDIQAYAQDLNNYHGFPDKTIVVFGNEENNLDLEWKNKNATLDQAASKYADDFITFAKALDKNRYRLAPAPPDLYNGVYDPVPWVKTFNSKIQAAGICGMPNLTLVANVFDLTPRIGGGNLDSYTYLEKNICSGLHVEHFGGWGPNPNNHPSIADQVTWLKTHKLPASVATATTLIIDTCNGKDSNVTKSGWLYYIRGKVYDINGNLIDPNTCDNRKQAAYFEYNIQRADPSALVNNLYDDYSVTCLPQEEYQFTFNNTGKCTSGDPSIHCNAGWNTNWDINASLNISPTGKLFGLFRDEAAVNSREQNNLPANRFESIESYFTTRNSFASQSQADLAKEYGAATPLQKVQFNNYQAPLYQLTTPNQQCQMVKDKLHAVQSLCDPSNRIEKDDTTCAVNENVPGTAVNLGASPLTDLQLLNQIDSIDCQQLMNPDPTDTRGQFLKNAILAVNPALEQAYRPAFIVAVTTFHPKTDQNVQTNSPGSNQSEDFQTIDYLEVKVPAFGSDFLPQATTNNDGNGTGYYRDPLLRTADFLAGPDAQNFAQRNEQTARDQIRTQGRQLKNGEFGSIIGNNGNLPVLCTDNDPISKTTGTSTTTTPASNTAGTLTTCDFQNKDKIPPALIAFINASNNAPDGVTPQLPCKVPETDFYNKNFYTNDQILKVAEQVKSLGSQLTPADQIGEFQKKKTIHVALNAKINDITQPTNLDSQTQLYFITPHNYGLQYAQNAFLSYLTPDQQAKLVSLGAGSLDSTGQFQLDPQKFSPLLKTGVGDTVDSQTSNHSSGWQDVAGNNTANTADQLNTNTNDANGKLLPVTKANTFPITGQIVPVQDPGNKARPHDLFWQVAGQVASIPTRLYAMAFNTPDNPNSKYAQSCTTDPSNDQYATENWLTGQCAVQAAPANAGTTPNTGGLCIETQITDQAKLQQYANDLEQNLSLPSSEALWTKYFSGYLPGAPLFLFRTCGSSDPCYTTIINAAVKQNLNPYLAIAIALNETGGLKSNQPDGSGPHFGCGVGSDGKVSSETIPVKMQCMLDFFTRNQNKSANQALSAPAGYGYKNGYNNDNLSTIIKLLNPKYQGVCQ